MFDHRALAQRGAARGGVDLLSQRRLQPLVLRNGDRSAMADGGGGAARAHGTAITHLGIKLDDGAKRKGLHVSLWAGNGAVAQIEREGRLGKLAAILRCPGSA